MSSVPFRRSAADFELDLMRSRRVIELLRQSPAEKRYVTSRLVGGMALEGSRDLIVNKYTLVAIAVPRQRGYWIDSAVNPKFDA